MIKIKAEFVKRYFWVLPLILTLCLVLIINLKPNKRQKSFIFSKSHLDSMNQQQLENEKLRYEIMKLQLENQKINNFWNIFPSYATLITALVAVGGVIMTIWKQINEHKRDRVQRADEKFASIVNDLGSERSSIQVSASVSILTFLKPEYKSYYDQVFLIILANLKVTHKAVVNKLLIAGFEKAVRTLLKYKKGEKVEFDLSNSNLYRVDLSGLDLSNVDLGFADLRHANFKNTILYRARGMEAILTNAKFSDANLEEARLRKAKLMETQFHDTRLVQAHLEETNLTKAEFYNSKMQGAHLEKAILNDTKFEGAKLADAYFYGATFNTKTLQSIIKAKKWDKAHFDDEIKVKLDELKLSNKPI